MVSNDTVASYTAKQQRKKLLQQHITGIENILSKDCTTKCVRNYEQMSSGRPGMHGIPYVLKASFGQSCAR
ncbi:hypothetical protein TNCV_4289201 [Trichonephila clavipes]|nr:hypothetical protein TNCV_4289201 [Trichonephila clavipes]